MISKSINSQFHLWNFNKKGFFSTQSSLVNEANFCVAVSLLSGGPAHVAGLPLASRFDSTEPLGQSHPCFRLLIFSNSDLDWFDYFVKVNVTHEGFCTVPTMSSKRFLKQNWLCWPLLQPEHVTLNLATARIPLLFIWIEGPDPVNAPILNVPWTISFPSTVDQPAVRLPPVTLWNLNIVVLNEISHPKALISLWLFFKEIVTLTTAAVPPEVGPHERETVGGPEPSGGSGEVELLLHANRVTTKTNNWINIKRFVIRRSWCLFLFRFKNILTLKTLWVNNHI